MQKIKFDIQLFADGKVVIETELEIKEFKNGISKMQTIAKQGFNDISSSNSKVLNSYDKLNQTIQQQKDKLNKLKSEYGSIVLEQGKSSAQSQKLEKEIEDLNNDLKNNETRLKNATSNVDRFSNSQLKAEKQTGKFAQAISKGLTVAFKTATIAIGSISTAMAGAITYGVKYNSTVEQLATSFEVMTGSSEEATNIVERLKDIGSKTPFEFTGLAETTQLLMNYGLTADEAIERMTMLGDISQGNADKMNRIAMAYGQMSSAGKVQLEDIKQMIEAGFNPLNEISISTGESMESLYNRISKGTISVDEITASMKRSTSEGGKYFQSMEKQSKTLAGQFSTLKDNASSLVGTLSQDITGAITSDVLPSINELLLNLETAFSEEGFAGFSEALGQGIANMITTIAEQAPSFIDSALLIIQNFITGIQNNLPSIAKSAVSIVMQLLMGVLDMLPEILQLGIDLVVELVNGIAESADELIPKIVETMLQLFMIITDQENLDKILNAGVTLIIALIEGIIASIPKLIENGETTLMALVNILSGGQALMLKIGWALLKAVVQGLIEKIPELKNKAVEIVDNLKQKFCDGISKIKDVGRQLMQGLWNGLKEKWDNLKSSVENLGKGIVNKFKSVFGIHSPSRVFRDEIGKYLAQGVGVGFEGELDSVYNDMQRAIDLETSKMSANVEASGTYQMAMASTPTFNLLDNSEHSTQLVVNGKVLAEVVNTENRNREVASA